LRKGQNSFIVGFSAQNHKPRLIASFSDLPSVEVQCQGLQLDLDDIAVRIGDTPL
jgi:hypothetical protein